MVVSPPIGNLPKYMTIKVNNALLSIVFILKISKWQHDHPHFKNSGTEFSSFTE